MNRDVDWKQKYIDADDLEKPQEQSASELNNLLCASCGEPCELVEVTYDYPGTHSNYGRAGTYHTGAYETKCCGDEALEGFPGWHIRYNPKPMPDRRYDYDYWHDDYDGVIDGNGLCGVAESVQAAIDEIGEIDYR